MAESPTSVLWETLGIYAHYYSHGTGAAVISTFSGGRHGSRSVGHSSKINRAIEATPVTIHLKDPTAFPHQRQYPLSLKRNKDHKLTAINTVSINGRSFQ
jgi:hypothetical protein